MATDKEKGKLAEWLDSIQQDSWQLELLISGFVIFLLIGGWGPLQEWEYNLGLLRDTSTSYRSLNFMYYFFRTAYATLLGCLLVHVLMRGLWIAAVGLRSVSGEIDYEELPYQPRFTDRLRRRMGSFDASIERLERNCSVVFSLAFLILFCFLSLTTWSLFAVLLQFVYLWFSGAPWQGTGILGGAGLVSLLVLVVSIIYLFDFITLGLLKRSKWFGRPYYYLYIFMGWVTLARLYRPLYYNLIDHRFGKRLAMLLPVAVLLIIMIASIKQINYAYFPSMINGGKVWLDHNNYDDENPNPADQYWRLSLASKFPHNNYLEAFMPYRPSRDDKVIKHLYPGLDVSQYVGTKLYGALQPLFYYHEQRRQPGLSFMIPVHSLPTGRHELLLKAQVIENDSLRWSEGRTIYFYK